MTTYVKQKYPKQLIKPLTKSYTYVKLYVRCKEMSEKNIVLCSEYFMPPRFECIWEKETIVNFDSKRKNKNGDNSRTEKLFILR